MRGKNKECEEQIWEMQHKNNRHPRSKERKQRRGGKNALK